MVARRVVAFNECNKARFVRRILGGSYLWEACETVGIGFQTLRLWLRMDPDLIDRIERAQAYADGENEALLKRFAKEQREEDDKALLELLAKEVAPDNKPYRLAGR